MTLELKKNLRPRPRHSTIYETKLDSTKHPPRLLSENIHRLLKLRGELEINPFSSYFTVEEREAQKKVYHLTKAREPVNGKAKTKISLWTSVTSCTMFNSETNNVIYLSVVL